MGELIKARALFLDDSPFRIEWFEHIWKGEYSIAITAKSCIEKLILNKYDILFLDHDLGGQVYVDPDIENCGMEVVRWLEHNDLRRMFIYIHTWNTPAGKQMLERLMRAGYQAHYKPFNKVDFYDYNG